MLSMCTEAILIQFKKLADGMFVKCIFMTCYLLAKSKGKKVRNQTKFKMKRRCWYQLLNNGYGRFELCF